MVYDLTPTYENRKSYYGKAQVVVNGNVSTLYSYDTPVMRITPNGIWRREGQPQSVTTSRHMCEFAYQHGYHRMGKQDLLALPVCDF